VDHDTNWVPPGSQRTGTGLSRCWRTDLYDPGAGGSIQSKQQRCDRNAHRPAILKPDGSLDTRSRLVDHADSAGNLYYNVLNCTITAGFIGTRHDSWLVKVTPSNAIVRQLRD
jgi:hypothetical protein